MAGYGVQKAQRLLHLSRGTIRGLIRKGFVTPSRTAHGYLFSFTDLVVLRAARDLSAANIPVRRINRSLSALRRQLPETAPLSGLHIHSVGSSVVVRQGNAHWHAESGQYLLALEVRTTGGQIKVIDRRASPAESSDDWFHEGLGLEDSDRQAAIVAYQKATLLDPRYAEAYVNWGRLLQSMGLMTRAEDIYRAGLRKCAGNAILLFNLGVLLEEQDRSDDALQAYIAAVDADPQLADGHFNLANLYHELGQEQAAFRHFSLYRRLIRG